MAVCIYSHPSVCCMFDCRRRRTQREQAAIYFFSVETDCSLRVILCLYLYNLHARYLERQDQPPVRSYCRGGNWCLRGCLDCGSGSKSWSSMAAEDINPYQCSLPTKNSARITTLSFPTKTPHLSLTLILSRMHILLIWRVLCGSRLWNQNRSLYNTVVSLKYTEQSRLWRESAQNLDNIERNPSRVPIDCRRLSVKLC